MFIHTTIYKSPVGDLLLGEFEDQLCVCDWVYRKQRTSIDQRIQKELKVPFKEKNTTLLQNTSKQLEEYFHEKRMTFELPVLSVGTEFQKSVWDSLLTIPYGETKSYLQLSRILGNEKAIRAVATANGANALSILIPCHRIIGSTGELVGYAGGLTAKKKLLQLEGALHIDNQINLF